MSLLRITVSADGRSDAALTPILDWVIRKDYPAVTPVIQFVDYRDTGRPSGGLGSRLRLALFNFPCDILAVHRDAESQTINQRRQEIEAAVGELGVRMPVIEVIPVRMTEAWLLHDEAAIRHAASNPNGREPIRLPPPGRVESLPDPKKVLDDALRSASGFSGRRLRNFHSERQVHRVAELIQEFTPLEGVPSFRVFRQSLAGAVARWQAL